MKEVCIWKKDYDLSQLCCTWRLKTKTEKKKKTRTNVAISVYYASCKDADCFLIFSMSGEFGQGFGHVSELFLHKEYLFTS